MKIKNLNEQGQILNTYIFDIIPNLESNMLCECGQQRLTRRPSMKFIKCWWDCRVLILNLFVVLRLNLLIMVMLLDSIVEISWVTWYLSCVGSTNLWYIRLWALYPIGYIRLWALYPIGDPLPPLPLLSTRCATILSLQALLVMVSLSSLRQCGFSYISTRLKSN